MRIIAAVCGSSVHTWLRWICSLPFSINFRAPWPFEVGWLRDCQWFVGWGLNRLWGELSMVCVPYTNTRNLLLSTEEQVRVWNAPRKWGNLAFWLIVYVFFVRPSLSASASLHDLICSSEMEKTELIFIRAVEFKCLLNLMYIGKNLLTSGWVMIHVNFLATQHGNVRPGCEDSDQRRWTTKDKLPNDAETWESLLPFAAPLCNLVEADLQSTV